MFLISDYITNVSAMYPQVERISEEVKDVGEGDGSDMAMGLVEEQLAKHGRNRKGFEKTLAALDIAPEDRSKSDEAIWEYWVNAHLARHGKLVPM